MHTDELVALVISEWKHRPWTDEVFVLTKLELGINTKTQRHASNPSSRLCSCLNHVTNPRSLTHTGYILEMCGWANMRGDDGTLQYDYV